MLTKTAGFVTSINCKATELSSFGVAAWGGRYRKYGLWGLQWSVEWG